MELQRQALRVADTPANRNHLNLQFEECFLSRRRDKQADLARSVLQEWSSIWPESPEHALRIVRMAVESLPRTTSPTEDDAEVAQWKKISLDNLERYQRLGGAANPQLEVLARNRFLANDANAQKLFEQIRRTPNSTKPK
jgi:hypothetical protein